MLKHKTLRYKIICSLVVVAQVLALLSVGTLTTLQPTPEQASQVALDAGLGSWVAGAAANVAAFGESLFGTQQTALAETGSFLLSASGGDFTCALNSNSGVQCWGQNNAGQLGNGTNTNSLIPVQVQNLTSGVIDLAAGDNFACALTSAGGVKCWGANNSGQLGNRDVVNKANSNIPVDVYQLQGGVTAIDAGVSHACALLKTGGMKCWGDNTDGQIGDGTVGDDWWPVDVVGLQSGVAVISAGASHTCAVLTDGTAKCWGNNSYGALGSGGSHSTMPVNVVLDSAGTQLQGIMSISAGRAFTCAVMTTGGAKCWGANSYGGVGDGTGNNTRAYPVDVIGLGSSVAAISAGDGYTCAVLTNSGVKCWGYNLYGTLGDGTNTNRNTPVGVSGLTSGVAAVSTSLLGLHTCAALTAGGVKCWGANTTGQLGNNSTTATTSPVNVGGSFTGYQVTVPLIRLIPAGGFDFGARNLNTTSTAQTATIYNPSAVALSISTISLTGTDASQFAISGGTCGSTFPLNLAAGSTCTVQVTFTPTSLGGKSAGITVASNANNAASVTAPLAGVGATIGSGAPTITSNGGLDTAKVSVFENGVFVTAVTAQGAAPISFSVFGGADASFFNIDQTGNLRFNNAPDFEAPADADHNNVYDVIVAVQNNIDTAIQEIFVTVQDAPDTFNSVVAVGDSFSCAVASGGSVKCWGLNTSGQVGDGTTANKFVPTPVTGLTGAVAVTAGDNFACALTSAGGVKCWGANTYGQLGDGTTTNRTTPVDVTGLTSGVVAIDAGASHMCALTSSGGAKCWGYNSDGQLGISGTGNVSSPADVAGLTSGVAVISAGASHTCAVLTDGTAKCWGNDSYGALGNVGSHSTTPVNVVVDANGVSVTGLRTISAGRAFTCAMLTTGGVKCWGLNSSGGLGDGTSGGTQAYPIDVPALPGAVNAGGVGVAAISAGNTYTCAALNDGSARCWGYNFYAAIGDGTTTNRTTPVRVTGLATSVVAISTSLDNSETCAATNDGNVKCWGVNGNGQLGVGTTAAYNYYPVMAGNSANPLTAPTAPIATLSPASGSIAFGNQAVSTTSAPQTVTINNSGASPLTINSASVTGSNYAISGGTCGTTFPVIVNAGASCTLQITFTPISTGLKASTFTLSSNSGGQATSSTLGLSGTGVAAGAPDLTTSIGQPSPALVAGSPSNVPLTVNNIGTGPTTGTVTASMTLPTGTSAPASFTSNGWTCTTSGQTVTCTTPGPIAAGGNSAIQVPVTPSASTVGTQPVFNGTSSGGGETNTGNNAATPMTPTTPVAAGTGAPDLTTTIGQPSPALVAGSPSNVPVTVSNVGTGPTTGTVTASMTLPTGTSAPASFTSGVWTCTTSGQTVTCTQPGPIAAGGSSAIQVPVTPSASTVGTTPSPFNGSASTPGETNTGNNAATPMTPTTPVTAGSAPDLTTSIGQPSPALVAGSPSNVPVTVSNVGSAPTTGTVTASMTLPTGTSAPASFTSNGWTCTTSGQTVTCTQPGPIAAGGSSAIQVPVTPSASTVGTQPVFNGTSSGGGETNTGNNNATPMTPTTAVAPASATNGAIKAILGGAYDAASGLMRDDLRTANLLPTTSPYASAAATANASVFAVTGNNAIVDWVLVELHDATTPATVSVSKSALIQRDGDIVDVDGTSALSFSGLSASSYYVAVKHRNHLGVMTGSPVTVNSNMVTANFTTMSAAYGTNAQRFTNNVYIMWPGDINGDGKVIMAGPNNDPNGILSAVLTDAGNTAQNTNYVVRGYTSSDLNLDGKVLASGPSNDRNIVSTTIFLYPGNTSISANYIASQQVP